MSQPPAPPTSGPAPPTTYLADDGNRYYRDADGQWVLFGHGLPPEAHLSFIPRMAGHGSSQGYVHGQSTGGNASAGPSHIPIDPALIPLPRQNEQELSQLRGGLPAPKTAGSRRSVKGKARERETSAPKRGRTKGSMNYHPDEVAAMLDVIEDELPVGAKGWAKVGCLHRFWAKENGFPLRADKSLEAKFKQLVKTPKPTGDAECPPSIERAHVIDNLISEKVGTRDLDDEDIDDRVSESSEDDGSDKENADDDVPPAKRPRVSKPAPTPLAHSVNSAPPRRTRTTVGAGMEVLSRISAGLDPAAQAARASDRATASFQNVQFMSLTQENRDLRAEITALRAQLMDAQRRQYDAERQADRLEQQAHFTRMLSDATERQPRRRSRWDPSPESRRRHHSVRVTPRRRFEVQYTDGAQSFWGYPEDAPEIDPHRTLLSYRETSASPLPRGREDHRSSCRRRVPPPLSQLHHHSPPLIPRPSFGAVTPSRRRNHADSVTPSHMHIPVVHPGEEGEGDLRGHVPSELLVSPLTSVHELE